MEAAEHVKNLQNPHMFLKLANNTDACLKLANREKNLPLMDHVFSVLITRLFLKVPSFALYLQNQK